MAAPQPQSDSDSTDGALDRLEAALDAIAQGLAAPKPAPAPAPTITVDAARPDLAAIEARIDAAIAHITAALDRAPDQ